jgi:hypothetical protein
MTEGGKIISPEPGHAIALYNLSCNKIHVAKK